MKSLSLVFFLALAVLPTARAGCPRSFQEIFNDLEAGSPTSPGLLAAYRDILIAGMEEGAMSGADLPGIAKSPFHLDERDASGRFQYADAMRIMQQAFEMLSPEDQKSFRAGQAMLIDELSTKEKERDHERRKTRREKALPRSPITILTVVEPSEPIAITDEGVNMQLSPAGNWLAIERELWPVPTGGKVPLAARLIRDQYAIYHDFSADSNHLAVLFLESSSFEPQIFDLDGSQLSAIARLQESDTHFRQSSTAISPGGDRLAYFYSVKTENGFSKPIFRVMERGRPSEDSFSPNIPLEVPSQIRFSADGKKLLGAGPDGEVVAWKVDGSAPAVTYRAYVPLASRRQPTLAQSVMRFVQGPPAEPISAVYSDGTVVTWNSRRRPIRRFPSQHSPPRGAVRLGHWSFSRDGRFLASIDGKKADEIRILSVRDGATRHVHFLKTGKEAAAAVSFSADGRYLAIAIGTFGNDRQPWRVEIWDLENLHRDH